MDDFKKLPVRVLPLAAAENTATQQSPHSTKQSAHTQTGLGKGESENDASAVHVFYMRENATKKEDTRFPPHRTVFVANVPCFMTVRKGVSGPFINTALFDVECAVLM